MASHITDPADFARHIREEMLAEFLRMRNPPIPFEISGDKPQKKKRANEDAVQRFVEAIKQLQDQKEAGYLFTELLYINDLAEQRHIDGLENQAMENGIVFGIADNYEQCAGLRERAFWWYIHHKDIFDTYLERADTEDLAGLRERIIKDEYIAEKERIADESKLIPLGEKIAKIYENALRGRKFRVSYFIEKDCVLVRVYLENLPENYLVFAGDQDRQAVIERTASTRSLFNVLIVYNQSEKTLGIRTTKPAENVPKLTDLFCRTFLNCTYADTTERKYNVENRGSVHMLELTPEPGGPIERCYLKAVNYMKIGDTSKTLRLDVGGRINDNGTRSMENMIETVFKKEDAPNDNYGGTKESEWIPKKFEIKFIFRKLDEKKGKKRQIVSHLTKRGVSGGRTPEEQEIRRFLSAKGFIS